MAQQQKIIALKIEDELVRAQLSQLCARLMPYISICFLDRSDDEVSYREDVTIVPMEDLLAQPVKIGTILERIDSHLLAQSPMTWQRGDIIDIGLYELFPDENLLRAKKGNSEDIRLTEKERDILLMLRAAKGAVVERATLLAHVWGYAKSIETHTLETHIYRLRQKIEKSPAVPSFLLTEEPGYRLDI